MAARSTFSAIILLSVVVGIVGCGGGGGGGSSAGTVTLEVSPGSAVMLGESQQSFSAALSDRAPAVADWSVQEPGGGSIVRTSDSTATYTAPGVSGTYHVLATSGQTPTQSVIVEIRVIVLPPGSPL
jgi:hypothetical protein